MPRLDVLAWLGSRVDRADLVVVASFAILSSATLALDRPSDARAVPDWPVAHATRCASRTEPTVVDLAPGPEPAVVRIDVCENGVIGVDVRGAPSEVALMAAARIDGGRAGVDPETWRIVDRFEWHRPASAGEIWVVGMVGGEAEARAWIAGTDFEPSR